MALSMEFLKKRLSALSYLNVTQFMGALNDNLFKMLIVFLLLDLKGSENENAILAWVGFSFVLPFLLFSQYAGILADKYSKKRIIDATKWLELGIAIIGLFVFFFQIGWLAYVMLFLMAAQSAFFGPSKYGIIPELVDKNAIEKANGSLSSFTYIAIIVGTFLASFLTEMTGGRLTVAGSCCVVVAIIGLWGSMHIPKTPRAGSDEKLRPFFPKHMWKTLRTCYYSPPLLAAILSSAYFLFIGGFTQLNIIPFTTQRLGLDKTKAGYLFLVCALGIASGSYLAGRFVKRSHITASAFAAIGIGIFSVLMACFAKSVLTMVIMLFMLGFFGGMFLIPVDSFIQIKVPDQQRGQVIAVGNVLSFLGVLAASLLLYVLAPFGDKSAAVGFGALGVLTFIVSIALIRSDIEEIMFLISKFTRHRRHPQLISSKPLDVPSVYIIDTYSRESLWKLMRAIPNVHPCIIGPKRKWFAWLKILGLGVAEQPGIELQSKLHSILERRRPVAFFENQWSQQTLSNMLHALGVGKEETFRLVQTDHGLQKEPYFTQ